MEDNRNNDVDFSYVAPDGEENRWIESIRRQYLPESEHDSKITQIKSLHNRARRFPKIIAAAMGVVGALVLGVGMTLTLVWDRMIAGIIVGLFGMAIMFFTYPAYQYLIERGKKKYGDQILKLTDEVSFEKNNAADNEAADADVDAPSTAEN